MNPRPGRAGAARPRAPRLAAALAAASLVLLGGCAAGERAQAVNRLDSGVQAVREAAAQRDFQEALEQLEGVRESAWALFRQGELSQVELQTILAAADQVQDHLPVFQVAPAPAGPAPQPAPASQPQDAARPNGPPDKGDEKDGKEEGGDDNEEGGNEGDGQEGKGEGEGRGNDGKGPGRGGDD